MSLQVCRALKQLHQVQAAHGDIHEGNMLRSADGQGIRLVDFTTAQLNADRKALRTDRDDLNFMIKQAVVGHRFALSMRRQK